MISRSPVQVRPLAPETGENREIFAGFLFICSDFWVANLPDPHRDPHGEMSKERRRGYAWYPLRRSVFFAACSHHLCHEITHLFGGALLHLPRDVGVGAECEACIKVTEHTGYCLYVHAVL